VWNAGFVGIWHGSWVPEDLYSASDSCRRAHGYVAPKALARALNDLMASKGSSSEIKLEDAGAALRFDGLEVGTWVFTFFDRSMHMAQIAANDLVVLSQFERNGETFKARPIKNQKAFRLDELPPSFLLLPSAGRGSGFLVVADEPAGLKKQHAWAEPLAGILQRKHESLFSQRALVAARCNPVNAPAGCGLK
jgi:hypothetical protein